MSSNNPKRLLVLYGSQTGCAKEVAERIVRQALRRRYEPEIKFMDAYNVVGSPLLCVDMFFC